MKTGHKCSALTTSFNFVIIFFHIYSFWFVIYMFQLQANKFDSIKKIPLCVRFSINIYRWKAMYMQFHQKLNRHVMYQTNFIQTRCDIFNKNHAIQYMNPLFTAVKKMFDLE